MKAKIILGVAASLLCAAAIVILKIKLGVSY